MESAQNLRMGTNKWDCFKKPKSGRNENRPSRMVLSTIRTIGNEIPAHQIIINWSKFIQRKAYRSATTRLLRRNTN